MKKKKSAIDSFDLDFSDVIDNAKNPAFAILEQSPAAVEIESDPKGENNITTEPENLVASDESSTEAVPSVNEYPDERHSPSEPPVVTSELEKPKKERSPKGKKGKNQYLSLEELIESGGKHTDVKYVRLTAETFDLVLKIKTRFGITIQDFVNTATYTACKQILDKK